MPSASIGGARSASASSITKRVDAAPRRCARLPARSIRGRARGASGPPVRAAPCRRRSRSPRSAGLATRASASRMPGMARIGPMLTIGLDGPMTTSSAVGQRRRAPRGWVGRHRRRRSAPRAPRRAARAARSRTGSRARPHRSRCWCAAGRSWPESGGWRRPARRPARRWHRSGRRRRAIRCARRTCVARSASPIRNQVSSPYRSSCAMAVYVSPATPHPCSRFGEAGEGVQDRVEVRADEQAEVLGVVADVDDHASGRPGGSAIWNPCASLAPPVPPARSVTFTVRG